MGSVPRDPLSRDCHSSTAMATTIADRRGCSYRRPLTCDQTAAGSLRRMPLVCLAEMESSEMSPRFPEYGMCPVWHG
jgi:hypothetical protein